MSSRVVRGITFGTSATSPASREIFQIGSRLMTYTGSSPKSYKLVLIAGKPFAPNRTFVVATTPYQVAFNTHWWRCRTKVRRSLCSLEGIQIVGKRFSTSSVNSKRASRRSCFCLRVSALRTSLGCPTRHSIPNSSHELKPLHRASAFDPDHNLAGECRITLPYFIARVLEGFLNQFPVSVTSIAIVC